MKFQPYPRYKDSGVEWLGEVPDGWEVVKVRRVALRIQTGGTPPTAEERYYEEGTIPWFGPGSFDNQIVIAQPIKLLNTSAIANGVARMFAPGATMVVTIGATLGKVSSLKNSGSCNQQITVIEFDPRRVHHRFAAYQLKRLEPSLRAIAPSATLPILDQNQIGNLPFCVSTIQEQCLIAEFLDSETRKIDELLGKKRRLIERLKEKRTALISRTVTRGLPPEAARAAGLNPHPKLKPSCIEWLGDVPEHWEIVPFRHHVDFLEQGWSPTADTSPAEEGQWGVLRLSAVREGCFFPKENKALEDIPSGINLVIPVKDDLLISRANTPELVGDACIVDKNYSRLIIPDLVYRLKLSLKSALPAFICSFLLSKSGRAQIESDARGSNGSMVKLGQSHVLSWLLPTPPLQEQYAISTYLTIETAKVDNLVAKVETAIERLLEYRTALITAAVTGKIDLRNVGAKGERA